MTTQQLATFNVADLAFGVDVARVQEVMGYQDVTPVPLAFGGEVGLINLRGEVVMTIDMRMRLRLPRLADDVRPMNVVVRLGDEVVSLLVDGIGDVATVTTDQFEAPPETMAVDRRALIHGAYKLENGLLLALNIERAADLGGPA